jgi:hypothetical protein
VVAEAVVDHLESIEVDQQHRDLGAAPVGPGERVVRAVMEQGAVRQPRE